VRRALALTLALAAAAAVFMPLCALAFDCGCRFFFLGGSDHCNMHAAHPPHCPLCTGSPLYGLAFGLVLWTAFAWPLDRLLRRRPGRAPA
jgi:hypothetical protein